MDLAPRLPAHAREAIAAFLAAHGRGPGPAGYVVGLSGGLDSALAARLARDAVGPERVLAVLLPTNGFPPALLEETEAYARDLGLETIARPIGRVEGAARELVPEVTDRVTLGNLTARIRMTILYTLARERGRLVLGTGNKSELLLGYFTKWGDGGVDLLPIGDLYKTSVRELAAELDLPEPVRRRAPTAGLWQDQTDEAELGLPYERLDRILHGLERLLPEPEIAERTGEAPEVVAAVVARVRAARHKRRMPPIAKVGLRTVGLDWKE